MFQKVKVVGYNTVLLSDCFILTPYLRNKDMRCSGRNSRYFSITQCFSIWDDAPTLTAGTSGNIWTMFIVTTVRGERVLLETTG